MLLGNKILQALLQLASHQSGVGFVVAANNLGKESFTQYRRMRLLLLAYNSKEYRSSYIITGLLVDDDKVPITEHKISDICERDVAAFFGVIQASIRVFLDNSSCVHLGLCGSCRTSRLALTSSGRLVATIAHFQRQLNLDYRGLSGRHS